MFSHFSMHIFW